MAQTCYNDAETALLRKFWHDTICPPPFYAINCERWAGLLAGLWILYDACLSKEGSKGDCSPHIFLSLAHSHIQSGVLLAYLVFRNLKYKRIWNQTNRGYQVSTLSGVQAVLQG